MIECQDVSFSYQASAIPDSEMKTGGALKHISCTLEDGSFVLLCGTSGCGKTTMTRLFNGLIPHYHEGTYTGSVYLDGKDTRDLSLFDISLKVGSVFQNPRSQFFNVDTTSELAFGPENHGMPEDIVRDRVKCVATQLKLEPLLDRSIFSLSGGEKQKIACGSAAAIAPDVYVLDEPSSNLDAYAIADFRQLLFTLKSQGKTIIISELRLYYQSGLFDRVLYLKDGEIEGDFTAEEWTNLIDRKLWYECVKEAEDMIDTTVKVDIQGYDIDGDVIKAARENAKRAGVEHMIHFQQRAVADLSHPKKYGFIITNPPYGERLEDKADLPELYTQIGQAYQRLDSWSMFLITSYTDTEKYIGRKADKNRKIYNGMLKTYFYQFLGPKPPKKRN